jgi:hypothetical protein
MALEAACGPSTLYPSQFIQIDTAVRRLVFAIVTRSPDLHVIPQNWCWRHMSGGTYALRKTSPAGIGSSKCPPTRCQPSIMQPHPNLANPESTTAIP